MYVSVDEVRNTMGVSDTSVVSDATIEQAIQWAEDEVDKHTNTTYYPNEDQGTATASDDSELTDSSKSWTVNTYANYAVYIYDGTGEGQIRGISSNTSDTLTLDSSWTTNPDTTSKYYITYLNKKTDTYDGISRNFMFVNHYPIVQVDSLTINDTSIDLSNVYVYNDTGKISLKNTATETAFGSGSTEDDRQRVEITYHYGILAENRRGRVSLPQEIKRFTAIVAGLKALSYQMGGTYDDLSTFSLPDFQGSIGQAYVNIKGTVDSLLQEFKELKNRVVGRYAFIE